MEKDIQAKKSNSIHISSIQIDTKSSFSFSLLWKNQAGSLIGHSCENSEIRVLLDVLFSQIKEIKSFEGQNQYRMMGAEERKADAEIF